MCTQSLEYDSFYRAEIYGRPCNQIYEHRAYVNFDSIIEITIIVVITETDAELMFML